jgi:hypothetical protein
MIISPSCCQWCCHFLRLARLKIPGAQYYSPRQTNMAKTAKLYQRLCTKRFNWVKCPIAKNGAAKPDSNAFQFGVHYSLDGERKIDFFPAIEQAVIALKNHWRTPFGTVRRNPIRRSSFRTAAVYQTNTHCATYRTWRRNPARRSRRSCTSCGKLRRSIGRWRVRRSTSPNGF